MVIISILSPRRGSRYSVVVASSHFVADHYFALLNVVVSTRLCRIVSSHHLLHDDDEAVIFLIAAVGFVHAATVAIFVCVAAALELLLLSRSRSHEWPMSMMNHAMMMPVSRQRMRLLVW